MKTVFVLLRIILVAGLCGLAAIAIISTQARAQVEGDLHKYSINGKMDATGASLTSMQTDLTNLQKSLPKDYASLLDPLLLENLKTISSFQTTNADVTGEFTALLDAFSARLTTLIIIISLSIGGIVLLLTILAMSFWAENSARRAIRSGYERGRQIGFQEGIALTIHVLDEDPSTLRNMMSWLFAYQQGKAGTESAYRIFVQLFARLQEKLRFHPVGKVGEIIPYDPLNHNTSSPRVRPGDRVRVTEVGWKLGEQFIRKPLVEREAI